jgi:hypothetical protein
MVIRVTGIITIIMVIRVARIIRISRVMRIIRITRISSNIGVRIIRVPLSNKSYLRTSQLVNK